MEGCATQDVGALSPLSDVEVQKLTKKELQDQLRKNTVYGASMVEFIDKDQAAFRIPSNANRNFRCCTSTTTK
eukprot:m.498110 g.498110  ORF g.498110 m.498110 type:complete len:73 (+) comp156408_c0_seq1:1-219(+)